MGIDIARYLQYIEFESDCPGASNTEELRLYSLKARKDSPLASHACVVFNFPLQ